MYRRAVPDALRFATGTASPWLTEVVTPVVTLSVFLALIVGAAVFLTVTLLRRGNSLTPERGWFPHRTGESRTGPQRPGLFRYVRGPQRRAHGGRSLPALTTRQVHSPGP